MTNEQRCKLDSICYRSTKGQHITLEEHEFCHDMFHKFPEEYVEIQKPASMRAHNEVNPWKGA